MKADEANAATPAGRLSKLDELLYGEGAPTQVDGGYVAAAARIETPAAALPALLQDVAEPAPSPAPTASTPPPAGALPSTTAAAAEADSYKSAPPPLSVRERKLPELWDEPTPEKRREIPKKALAIAAGVGLLLLLPLLFGRSSDKAAEGGSARASVPEDLIVSESDLRNRVEVSADDFRPKRVAMIGAAPREQALVAPPPLESESGDGSAAVSRRPDPEDLIAHRRAAGGAGTSSSDDGKDGKASTKEEDGYRRPFIYLQPSGGSPSGSAAAGGSAALVPAGAVLPVSLATPIDIRGGGGASCIALVEGEGALPKGSRFVGRASTDGEGRLMLRFERVFLPDGHEAKVEAEAQDGNGAFGLEGTVTEEGGRSVARDIAADTAADVATEAVDTFTGGLIGRVVGHTVNRVSSRRGMAASSVRRVSLPAGSKFQLFLHQAVIVR